VSISVRHISKHFKGYTALQDVSLEVKTGELIALLGPSGSGKTTLMRIIAGLELPDSGSVMLNGQAVQNKGIQQRNVGFVFQHYALFKHMSVFENVAFGLRVRKGKNRPSEELIKKRVMELLGLVHLERFYDRYPAELSGGQRQRVALARALAVEPGVLLLDEPFGALDAKVRKELRRWMRRLHDEMPITSVFVTHDQEEAMEVADRVVVMSNGKIEQIGTPEEVWQRPVNAFVYDFLGNYNEFDGWKDTAGVVHLAESESAERDLVLDSVPQKTAGGLLGFVNRVLYEPPKVPILPYHRQGARAAGQGKPVKIYARPHEMQITKTPDAEHEYIRGQVIHINPAGPLVKLELERPNGQILQIEIPKSVIKAYDVVKGDILFTRPKDTKVFE